MAEPFQDEQDRLAASFDSAIALAAEHTIPCFAAQTGPLGRVATAVARLLSFCEQQPELAAVLLVPAPQTAARHARMVLTMTRVARSELDLATDRRPPHDACAAAVGSAVALVARWLCESPRGAPPAIARAVLELILAPYFGEPAAACCARRLAAG